MSDKSGDPQHAKSFLIISPFAFIQEEVAYARINQIYRTLKQAGHHVVVLGYSSDSVSGCSDFVSVRMPRFLSGLKYNTDQSRWWSFAQNILHQILARLRLDRWSVWAVLAFCRMYFRRPGFDYLIASSPPVSVLTLAKSLATFKSAKIIGDFRDIPVAFYSSERGVTTFRSYLDGLDAFMSTTNFQASTVQSVLPDLPCLLSGGFISGEIGPLARHHGRSSGEIRLIYGGALYLGQRNLSPLFKAIASSEENLLLDLYLDPFESKIIQQQLEEAGLGRRIGVHAFLPRDEFFQRCLVHDIGLIIIGVNKGDVDHENAIPGKYYEYLRAGLKILAFCPKDSAMSKELKSAGTGLSVDVDADASEVLDVVNALVRMSIDRSNLSRYDAHVALTGLLNHVR
jgi:hypothetical protein